LTINQARFTKKQAPSGTNKGEIAFAMQRLSIKTPLTQLKKEVKMSKKTSQKYVICNLP
jgi:hypothetical protein